MVVASNGRAFGSAAKEVAVKKPLLVQATLPRVVSTDEEIELPVTVFALEKGVGKTDVRVTVNEAFSVVGPQSRSVVLGDEGEQVVTFPAQGGPADRDREGPRHGGLFRRQLRLGDRDRRAGAESLRHDLGGPHSPAGRNGPGEAPESLRDRPSGTFVDSSDRPFAPPRIPRALPPRLHRADHLGSLPATLPALRRGVRRRDVAGHRPQYQERPVAAGELSALQRRIRLLERRNLAPRSGARPMRSIS